MNAQVGPPKQMFVVSGSGIGMCSVRTPSREDRNAVHERRDAHVAVRVDASESSSCKPQPPADARRPAGVRPISPGPQVPAEHPAGVRLGRVRASGESPTPFGESSGYTISRTEVPSGRA
jgi:hypothetical protein